MYTQQQIPGSTFRTGYEHHAYYPSSNVHIHCEPYDDFQKWNYYRQQMEKKE